MSFSSSSRKLSQENPIPRPNYLAKTRTSSLRDVGNRRVPLGEITNQKPGSKNSSSSSTLVHCSNKIGQSKKAPKPIAKSIAIVPYEATQSDQLRSSTHDSLENPKVEYMVESSTIALLESSNTDFGNDDKIVNIDSNLMDPQLCGVFASDIYQHLRVSELEKRPALDYMERMQPNINANMRSILIDWLVEVADEYRLSSETLYLAVNYIDRYLTGNVIARQNLQLLGVACMMIATKYEDVCVPQVEDFCYITDNTYSRDELLEMESSVLNYLKFELTTPTANCFLRRFLRAAQGGKEVPSLLSEYLACYLTELSLLDYAMLRYTPSLIAASAVFLTQHILHPSIKPWNATLEHYTSYKATHMEACVKDLLQLCRGNPSSDVVAIRKKYSQHKYKFAAKKLCPTSLPQELFLC
ncbi:PREDICTED: cyclin-A1-2-like [Camelina sativa]|uniref:Cyclin-A1-2-like n=1 Tax=Camelina sativa TaxID=90675 RepID=A0ABM0TN77_CAMSA|nr:PREDICTED: cyclin-A1-2-like [Camelina sativa]